MPRTSTVDELKHFGVKGMKWGVRKADRPTGPEEVSTRQTPGRHVKTEGGRRLEAHPDAVRAATNRQKARKSTTDSLSNKELQELINRMNMEQQYSTLMQKRSVIAKGQKFAKKITAINTGVNDAQKAVSSTMSTIEKLQKVAK